MGVEIQWLAWEMGPKDVAYFNNYYVKQCFEAIKWGDVDE